MKNLSTAIKAAKSIAPKTDVRYYLNGVALYIKDNDIVSVAATDGNMLILLGSSSILDIKQENCAVIANEDLPILERALLKSNDVELIDGILKIGDYSMPISDGRFPDIKRVIPAKKRNTNLSNGIGVNTSLLSKLDKVSKCLKKNTLSDRDDVHMKMEFETEKDSILCTFESQKNSIDDCICVIMPMRF